MRKGRPCEASTPHIEGVGETTAIDNVDVASGVNAAEAWRAGVAVALIFVAFFSRCF